MRSLELGPRRTELRRTLVAAVLRGEKIATASLREDYEPATEEGMSRPGERLILLGFDDEPLGLVQIGAAQVVRATDVDVQFGRDEGEGFKAVSDWRAAPERAWAHRLIPVGAL